MVTNVGNNKEGSKAEPCQVKWKMWANALWGVCWKGEKKLTLNFANLSKQIK